MRQKAAMFGLDARIALAIFAALSVITGAVLHSALQEAKVISLITEMQEIGKAWEQYYLDTGVDLSRNNTDPNEDHYYIFNSKYLVEKPTGVVNWKGPYLNYPSKSYYLRHPLYDSAHVMNLTTDDGWSVWFNGKCTTGKACAIYISLNSIPNITLAKKVDVKIDNSDGADQGKFRWSTFPAIPGTYRFILQYALTKNPND